MHSDLVHGIEHAYAERANPIVFALTGRTGSGCTTAASSLAKPFGQIALTDEGFPQPERRKMSIVMDFARSKWVPFSVITVSTVIYSFLLDLKIADLETYLIERQIAKPARDKLKEQLADLARSPSSHAFNKAMKSDSTLEEKAAAWQFFDETVSALARQARSDLSVQYPMLFQRFGDNIRFSGNALQSVVRPESLFSLMDRVRHLIECLEAYQQLSHEKTSRVVIDAIRNPLELVYLRRHIAGLYVIAITADDKERRARLLEGGLGKDEVDAIDAKEYNDTKHLADYSSFVSQNLKDCIQKSDIFVANPGSSEQLVSSVRFMNAQLVRYVVLTLRPGLVTPTREERCMQVAFVAKLNSGCISRQVGAVVADRNHSISALGWNDAPKGQSSCLLRDVNSLLAGSDDESFSEYEKTDVDFRSHLEKKFAGRESLRQSDGLRCPFCFKDAFNLIKGKDNQVHTRSLHAEENAFLQLAKRGSSGIAGGTLYTTASPCELCSKKAYQLGICEVIYVDPYPGISTTHVLKSGPESARPKLRLFSGAVGHAYHRLYESLLSIKDEYGARMRAFDDAAGKTEIARTESRNLNLFE